MKEERNKDRQTKIVHVKQNKLFVWENTCRAAATDVVSYRRSLESDSPGFLKHDSKGGNKTGIRSLKAQNKSSLNCCITYSKGSQTRCGEYHIKKCFDQRQI